MLFYLEGCSFVLHLDAHLHVEVHLLCGSFLVVLAALIELRVVGIFDEVAGMVPIAFVYACLNECGIHIILDKILAREIDHRTRIASFVDDEEAGNACILSHLGIVGTKGWSNMYDTCTILGSNIIARDNTEGVCTLINNLSILQFTRFYPGEELFILHAYEVSTFATP